MSDNLQAMDMFEGNIHRANELDFPSLIKAYTDEYISSTELMLELKSRFIDKLIPTDRVLYRGSWWSVKENYNFLLEEYKFGSFTESFNTALTFSSCGLEGEDYRRTVIIAKGFKGVCINDVFKEYNLKDDVFILGEQEWIGFYDDFDIVLDEVYNTDRHDEWSNVMRNHSHK